MTTLPEFALRFTLNTLAVPAFIDFHRYPFRNSLKLLINVVLLLLRFVATSTGYIYKFYRFYQTSTTFVGGVHIFQAESNWQLNSCNE
jgi:hypothetical protein